MKYVVIIPDGACDFPQKSLDGKTPLEAAKTPNMDFIAKNGQTGLMQTSFHNLPIGSIVANMGILGYNPLEYYPNGRASFEALAQGIELKKNDIVFRCNLISVKKGRIVDFTSNMISDYLGRKIIESIKTDSGFELYPGQSYRNLLILRNAKFRASDIICFEPHMNIGEKVNERLPVGTTFDSIEYAKKLNKFILDSVKQLTSMNEKYATSADMLWPWSPSHKPSIPSFEEKYGMKGGIVAGLDFMRGIGMAAAMEAEEIPGTTGYIDTDLKAKLNTAERMLEKMDFVFIHVNAPDEESHAQNTNKKIKSIENIDKEIVGPIIKFLESTKEDFRIAIIVDHYTLLNDKTHNNKSVPFAIYGAGIKRNGSESYTEKEIERKSNGSLIKSYKFMKSFLSEDKIF
ncbi:MAG: 2,3-bisphosphoglycerate-independent phosphoglycerate mutase [Candidatus Aenigmarchaeota archaeon]|nr:2,3-bisphosphoglycerate-independent phosphoglycerate mutase [Candidatus Aenigmarchaeota archaeon]